MTHLSGLLSVIVLAPEAGESMARCVDGLMKDCEDPPLEILVVARRLTPALERLEQKQGMRVRAVICGEASLPRMRAVGVREARGAWVAFLSEWSEPSRGWLGALREGLLGGAYAVGGEVENGAGNRCVDWAVHFLEYAAFAPPLPAGPAPRVPGNNAAFRRDLLQEVLNSEEAAEEWDWMWQARLREQGVEFRTAPGMTVLQRRRFRFVEFCRQRYWYSRSVAALRLRGRGGLSRIVYAAAATQLPALLWWRHARTMLSRRWSHGDARARRGLWRRWLTAMPWIVVFLFAGAWGEFCGALFGDGGSREKIPW